jgi:hypothetical protein
MRVERQRIAWIVSSANYGDRYIEQFLTTLLSQILARAYYAYIAYGSEVPTKFGRLVDAVVKMNPVAPIDDDNDVTSNVIYFEYSTRKIDEAIERWLSTKVTKPVKIIAAEHEEEYADKWLVSVQLEAEDVIEDGNLKIHRLRASLTLPKSDLL